MTAAQSQRAIIIHQALTGLTPPVMQAQAQNLIGTATALAQQQHVTALSSGQIILSGASQALKLLDNPKLESAVAILDRVNGAVAQVQSAISEGKNLPMALAQITLDNLPPGTPRDIAQALYRLTAFVTVSKDSQLAGAQGLISQLANAAFQHLGLPQGQSVSPADFFRNLTQTFVSQLVSGTGLDKYLPASMLHAGIDLLFVKAQKGQGTP